MCYVSKSNRRESFLLILLILIICDLNYVISFPVDSSNLATISKDLVISDNAIKDSVNDLTQGLKKKKKRKRRKKKKSNNKDRNGLKDIVADLASVFANFLSSVTDVPKDNEAIKVIKIIAESVIRKYVPYPYDNILLELLYIIGQCMIFT